MTIFKGITKCAWGRWMKWGNIETLKGSFHKNSDTIWNILACLSTNISFNFPQVQASHYLNGDQDPHLKLEHKAEWSKGRTLESSQSLRGYRVAWLYLLPNIMAVGCEVKGDSKLSHKLKWVDGNYHGAWLLRVRYPKEVQRGKLKNCSGPEYTDSSVSLTSSTTSCKENYWPDKARN